MLKKSHDAKAGDLPDKSGRYLIYAEEKTGEIYKRYADFDSEKGKFLYDGNDIDGDRTAYNLKHYIKFEWSKMDEKEVAEKEHAQCHCVKIASKHAIKGVFFAAKYYESMSKAKENEDKNHYIEALENSKEANLNAKCSLKILDWIKENKNKNNNECGNNCILYRFNEMIFS